jgi:hypothetical protein
VPPLQPILLAINRDAESALSEMRESLTGTGRGDRAKRGGWGWELKNASFSFQ